MIYDKKRPRFVVYPLFVLLLLDTHTHTHTYIYIYIVGSSCFVLAVGSASDGSSAKHSTIFLEMPKANHIKIVTFRKHLSRS